MNQVVYFIQDGNGRIKIGTTGDLRRRFDLMQTHTAEPLCVIGVIDGGREKERELHESFRELRYRSNGEWFESDASLLAWIKHNTRPADLKKKPKTYSSRCTYSPVARQWLHDLVVERIELGFTRVKGINAIAEATGLLPGSIENLLRGRTEVLAREWEAIRLERMAYSKRKIIAAKAQLAELTIIEDNNTFNQVEIAISDLENTFDSLIAAQLKGSSWSEVERPS